MVSEERVNHINSIAGSLTSAGHAESSAIKKRQDQINRFWAEVKELANARQHVSKILFSSIHCSMGSAPVGVQCPLTSSLCEFPDYWDWLWYPALLPVLVSIAFPFAFHISMFFHSLFFTSHWMSFVFLLCDWCICAHLSTLHLLTFSVSFQAWDWLCYPMLWSQKRIISK